MTERLNWTRFVIALLPRSKRLNFVAAVTVCSDFGAQENKTCHCFQFFPVYLYEMMELDATILVFWMLSFKLAFSLSSFTLMKRRCSYILSPDCTRQSAQALSPPSGPAQVSQSAPPPLHQIQLQPAPRPSRHQGTKAPKKAFWSQKATL